jgi:cob(I)alamin adenosyltransferase
MIIYYYGNGKGKTTAAFGAVLRATGYGWSCLVLQAIKGKWLTGEKKAIKRYLAPKVEIETLGRGFVGIHGDTKLTSQHQIAAEAALQEARQAINQRRYRLIILDEYGDLPKLQKDNAIKLLTLIDDAKEQNIHLIITGHQKQPAIAQAADLVTKMINVKHPYECGIMAVEGIDY